MITQAFADPLVVPFVFVGGVALGAVLCWPIAYLHGKANAQSRQTDTLATYRNKYLESTGLRAPASRD